MAKLLFVLIFVSACFIGGGPYIPEPRAADKNSKLITRVWDFVDPYRWKISPWYRLNEDVATPGSIIEAGDYACILTFPDTNQPRPGHNYVCESGWRPAQRRGS